MTRPRPRPLLAAALLFALGATPAFAGERDPLGLYALPTVASHLTRAQVQAEVAAALADGSLNAPDTRAPHLRTPTTAPALTRQQVREETQAALRARRSGSSFEGS